MPAPSKPFTTIADGDIDPESPLTTTLMTAYRDRDQNLKEWLGGSFVAAVDHNHDGVNSSLLPGNVAGALFLWQNYFF
jgi:hypothetical protein